MVSKSERMTLVAVFVVALLLMSDRGFQCHARRLLHYGGEAGYGSGVGLIGHAQFPGFIDGHGKLVFFGEEGLIEGNIDGVIAGGLIEGNGNLNAGGKDGVQGKGKLNAGGEGGVDATGSIGTGSGPHKSVPAQSEDGVDTNGSIGTGTGPDNSDPAAKPRY